LRWPPVMVVLGLRKLRGARPLSRGGARESQPMRGVLAIPCALRKVGAGSRSRPSAMVALGSWELRGARLLCHGGARESQPMCSVPAILCQHRYYPVGRRRRPWSAGMCSSNTTATQPRPGGPGELCTARPL
jgi:hypothetical protein